MKPTAAIKPATKTESAVASSLGGADRHVAIRTLDRNMAGDFEIGPLASDSIDTGLAKALAALETALEAGVLPYDLFDESAAAIARLMYAEALSSAPAIVSARFSAPRSAPGGTTSVELRVFSESRASATGLAILSSDETGAWRIEHFELDAAALVEPAASGEPIEPWDPYATAAPR